MRDVTIYATHWVAIVCIILDEHKRAIILDSSRVYLKGTSFFITEDRIPKEQERSRQAYASRKGIQNAWQVMTRGTTSTSNLKFVEDVHGIRG